MTNIGQRKERALVAMIKGTGTETLNAVLRQLPEDKRKKVEEVTLDMAANMEKIVRRGFPKAQLVTEAFMPGNWSMMRSRT